VRLFVSRLDFKPLYAFMLETDRGKDEQHAAACVLALQALEARFAAGRAAMPETHRSAGPFFLGGSEPSAADVALLPFLDRLAPGLQAYRGFHLWQAAQLPRLGEAWCAMQARPAWQATSQPAAFYVSAYEGYAAGKRGVPHRVRAASPDAAAYAAVPPCAPP
jgi:glutathione S-transferase